VSSIFKFKKFDVLQRDSVLKVGTDSMLLGSLIDPGKYETGLDLGAGSGVLSLMVAQRNKDIHIDAIENHRLTFKECDFNFKSSSFATRLNAIHDDYFEFVFNKKYDLIFSNPPFYMEDESLMKDSNRLAKHGTFEQFRQLVILVGKQLSKKGNFWLVLPYDLHQKMIQIELFKTLYINNLHIVHSKTNKLNSRVIVSYSFHKKDIVENELVIRNSDNTYTSEYIKLTKDFHYNKL